MTTHAVHVRPRLYAVPVPFALAFVALSLDCFAPHNGQKGVVSMGLWHLMQLGILSPLVAHAENKLLHHVLILGRDGALMRQLLTQICHMRSVCGL